MLLKSGTRLGPYEVVDAIGIGGMGQVYRARDNRLGRDVAVKVLPEEFSRDPDRLRRFEREARAAAALSHPNVVAVYDVGVHEGVPYVVTELLEGETLGACLKRKPLPIEKVVEIAIQVVSGLAATHARGIVHRDLKPDNIFITGEGHVKILDYGIAKITPTTLDEAAETLVTDTGVVMGTLGYMSPEQVRGAASDGRSDIFSLGAIVYEAFSGRRAFSGLSDADTICAILERDPPPLQSAGVSAPTALLRIVARCLEKDPARRFQSSADLKFALEFALANEVGIPPRSVEKSIAVCPFVNMSTSDQEFFSDGLAEELINALAQLPGLRVASRSSSFRFRGSDLDVRDVGKQLNVDAILEGSVRRAGNRLRVTVQLINVADGYHIWSERYDRELADIFAIQDEITQSIVQRLEPKLLGLPRPVHQRHTEDLEAYELYLKGRHFWYQRTESSLRAGITCFVRAIEVDPSYALAHAGLADSFSIMRAWQYVSSDEARERTEAAAKRALSLNPALAEAHFSMALYRYWLTDEWQQAEPHFRRALEIQPRSSHILTYYGNFLSNRRRFEEAVGWIDKALEVDPTSPFVCALASLSLSVVRRYERALDLAHRALELHPDSALGLYALGLVSSRSGSYDRAIEAYVRLLAITNRASIALGMLGCAYACAGRTNEATLLLNELVDRASRQFVDPLPLALIYVALGDRENLEQQLNHIVEQHGTFANVEQILGVYLDPLAHENRFQDLFTRLHLPERKPAM